MAPWIEEIFTKRTEIMKILQENDVELLYDIEASGWFERQLILKGSRGRNQFLLGFFALMFLFNALVFYFVFIQ